MKVIALDETLSEAENIAIFAIFPRVEMSNSINRARDYMARQGFKVIFIVNENSYSSVFISQLEKDAVTVILRRNIGHDFGAYQAGIAFLESGGLYKRCERLVLLNDSTIYTPKSESLLQEYFAENDAWKCLTLSTEPEFHAQSYFLSFTAEILRRDAFKKFWKKYYPTSLRHLVIRKGEIGLSRVLIEDGWLPNAFTVDVRTQKLDLMKEELRLEEKIALFSGTLSALEVENPSEEMVENRFFHELYEKNPSQKLGLYLSRVAGVPLKRDLLYACLYSLQDVLGCLRTCGIAGAELIELRNLFLSTMVLKGGTVRLLWRRAGLTR